MKSAHVPSVKHSAAGPYLGFALQPVRLCYYLLCSPADASVSLEHLDDVAVHYADGTVLVEQSKSALSHNALSNSSTDLWKTVANWLDAVKTKKLDKDKTKFLLYVTPIKSGVLSSALHVATSAQDVMTVVKQVKDKLTTKAEPPKCIAFVQRFLDATDEERLAVVGNMSVESKDSDPLDALRKILTPTLPDSSIDIICQSAIGIAKEWADKCIRGGNPAIISVAEFRKVFHTFVQRNNLPGYLPTFSTSLTEEEAKGVLSEKPNFIRQLLLVEAPEDQQIRAASDLMRTSADKVKWAEQGLVFDGSFTDWDDSLLRRHAAIQGEINDLYSDRPEVVRGRTVYNRCSALKIPLDSREVPDHFTNGGFNELADKLSLGWHPQYSKLLGEEREE